MRVLDPLLSWLELWKVLFLVGAGAWLDEGVGSLAVLAGAVEGLVSGEGGSLAGVPVEQGDGGCQYQAGD